MVIWTRWGILGLLIPCLFIGPAEALMPASNPSDPKSVQNAQRTGYLLGSLLSAAVLWPLGRRLNHNPLDTPFDPNTGQENLGVPGGTHTMFFVPLEYWAFIWLAFGLFKFF